MQYFGGRGWRVEEHKHPSYQNSELSSELDHYQKRESYQFCLSTSKRKVRLDLKNCSFAVTRPTQLWRRRLKIFYWTFKSKKNKKKIPKVTDHFNVKFYFSNAWLNFVEEIYYFPQHNIKRTYASFQVSKCSVFFLTILTVKD